MKVHQLQAAQDELVRKDRLAVLGHLADALGHELRNPLGVMSNVVYLLETMCEHADDTAKEYLGILKAQIGEADRIISDLLDAVRTLPPQLEEVAVADLVEQVLRNYPVPGTVAIKVEISALLPRVRVDPRQIQQALHKLLSNAVDAMAEGGSLEIRAREHEGDVAIAVADTGAGMTAQQLTSLFQPLVTSKSGRIGLGLMVVKNLTEANGGRVEVASEAGKGTTVTLMLPAVRVV
jgi:signal transduction histidine kinase